LNPVQAWIFFRLYFHSCLSCVCNCDDQLFKYMIFHIFICILHILRVYCELTWPALSGLIARSVGRERKYVKKLIYENVNLNATQYKI